MDSECRRALTLHRNAYYVLARELEEDIFAQASSTDSSPPPPLPGVLRGSPSVKTGAGSGSPGAATCRPQLHKRQQNTPVISGASPFLHASASIHSYRLSPEYVHSVLSQSQLNFLEDLRAQKQTLIREYLSEQGGVGHPAKRLHLRKISKVPWRCVFVRVYIAR